MPVSPAGVHRSREQTLTLSVGELAEVLNATFELVAPYGVWVEGEVAGISRPGTGHVYFDMVEPADTPGAPPVAKVGVALLRWKKAEVNAAIRNYGNAVRITGGVRLRIHGHLDYYAPTGRAQLMMDAIDPAHTLGRIAADRDIVLGKLAAEGVLRRNAARALPAVPLRVGLVSSVGSAAHADVIRTLADSGLAFTVKEIDVRVQGADAPSGIAAAVGCLGRRSDAADADVVLLVRGGGSKTDLVAFDHESVARAVALCPLPVFTGIGHEIDRSAADGVAHTACATPTAAAEAVIALAWDWLHRLDETALAVAARSRRALDGVDGRLGRAAADAVRAARFACERGDLKLAAAGRRMPRAAGAVEQRSRQRLSWNSDRLSAAARAGIREAERRLASAAARAQALEPAAMMRRGWSITRREDGSLVRSANDVAAGERLISAFLDGTVTSTVSTRP